MKNFALTEMSFGSLKITSVLVFGFTPYWTDGIVNTEISM